MNSYKVKKRSMEAREADLITKILSLGDELDVLKNVLKKKERKTEVNELRKLTDKYNELSANKAKFFEAMNRMDLILDSLFRDLATKHWQKVENFVLHDMLIHESNVLIMSPSAFITKLHELNVTWKESNLEDIKSMLHYEEDEESGIIVMVENS